MLLKKPSGLTYAEVTPKATYLNRRQILRAMGITGAALVGGKVLSHLAFPPESVQAGTKLNVALKSPFSTTEKQSSFEDVTHYNNFYEFGTDKTDPSKNAENLKISPWTVSIEGEVKKPRTLTMDDILKVAPLEERIYRHRCVERWSIVVPWIGYSFSELAKLVEPTDKAKYVAFTTFFDPRQMPQAKYGGVEFPYVEGLRIDEAMNPLALLCVGMYGESLPNQDGAPVRMVLPWKYGYKSIKSLVKIRFVKDQPPTTWNLYSDSEYGFYSNVNPTVEHPRWSQATERRLGEIFTRKTMMFNGYSDQVASLYTGMDLKKFH
jgi:sulfoxide reductase catalytic subunit YedY